jgi:hypothetical protein
MSLPINQLVAEATLLPWADLHRLAFQLLDTPGRTGEDNLDDDLTDAQLTEFGARARQMETGAALDLESASPIPAQGLKTRATNAASRLRRRRVSLSRVRRRAKNVVRATSLNARS